MEQIGLGVQLALQTIVVLIVAYATVVLYQKQQKIAALFSGAGVIAAIIMVFRRSTATVLSLDITPDGLREAILFSDRLGLPLFISLFWVVFMIGYYLTVKRS